jgi:hypothetical protein
LTQTLLEGGKKVLLVERGGERGPETYNIMTTDEAVLGNCADTYSSEGARVTMGNCIGGATSINGGVYITEEPEWLIAEIMKLTDEDFFDKPAIESAFAWITERVAPEPTQEIPGSGTEMYIAEFARALLASESALDKENLDPGQSSIPLTTFQKEFENLNILSNHETVIWQLRVEVRHGIDTYFNMNAGRTKG